MKGIDPHRSLATVVVRFIPQPNRLVGRFTWSGPRTQPHRDTDTFFSGPRQTRRSLTLPLVTLPHQLPPWPTRDGANHPTPHRDCGAIRPRVLTHHSTSCRYQPAQPTLLPTVKSCAKGSPRSAPPGPEGKPSECGTKCAYLGSARSHLPSSRFRHPSALSGSVPKPMCSPAHD